METLSYRETVIKGGSLIEVQNEPRFHVNQIVYLLFNGLSPRREYPYLNSPYEIDCKIAQVIEAPPDGSVNEKGEFKMRGYTYNLISGHGNNVNNVREQYIISVDERPQFLDKKTKQIPFDNELCKAGTLFVLEGEYWANEVLGIYIREDRMNELNIK